MFLFHENCCQRCHSLSGPFYILKFLLLRMEENDFNLCCITKYILIRVFQEVSFKCNQLGNKDKLNKLNDKLNKNLINLLY